MRLRTARAILHTIVDRASTDTTYLEQLRANPVDMLVKEGLPYDIIEDFLQETSMEPEVSGYLLRGCANTCALTRTEAYPAEFLSAPRAPLL